MKTTFATIITILALLLGAPVVEAQLALPVPTLPGTAKSKTTSKRRNSTPPAKRSTHPKPITDSGDQFVSATPPAEVDPELKWDNAKLTLSFKGKKYKLRKIEGGSFIMGANGVLASDADNDEKPTHKVTIDDYYIGESEVPQWLWVAVMGNNPSAFPGENNPVEMVSYDDCINFINTLNTHFGINLRLPTEAEWEYAAREGSQTRNYLYSGSSRIDDVAWYEGNSGAKTHPVKTKKSNRLGLYDMTGNVSEWCSDWMDNYSNLPAINPKGPKGGTNRIFRGGAWICSPRVCRVSFRYYNTPDYCADAIGLRLAL